MFPDSRLLCRHASYWSFGPLIILWQTGQSWLEIWSWYIWLQTIFIFPLVRWIDVVTILALTISILASGVSPGSNLDCWNRWILLPTVERNNAVCVKKGLDGFWRASNQSFVLCSCIPLENNKDWCALCIEQTNSRNLTVPTDYANYWMDVMQFLVRFCYIVKAMC